VKKTDNFFLISNYNADPAILIDYCKDYVVFDQSDQDVFKRAVQNLNFISTTHTGHNISDYFRFFIDNYTSLPDFIALLKGNIIGRHLSKAFFERVYDNKYYTFLYEDRSIREKIKKEVFFLSLENQYLEINNSWYAPHHPHKYFNNFNKLLKFIYKDPLIPEYCCFAPGACYIVSKSQVLKYSKKFYTNLNKIISYTLEPKFPSEAHQIERMLHIIYSSNYEVNEYMNNENEFEKALSDISNDDNEIEPNFLNKLKARLKKISIF
jgi:hypothetical protein